MLVEEYVRSETFEVQWGGNNISSKSHVVLRHKTGLGEVAPFARSSLICGRIRSGVDIAIFEFNKLSMQGYFMQISNSFI